MKRASKKLPAMSADEATAFDRFSLVNAAILEETAALKGCGCRAYEDWFTYKRWIAQGMQVQRGEHSTRIAVIIHSEKENDAGQVESKSLPRTVSVFCRCQVQPAAATSPARLEQVTA